MASVRTAPAPAAVGGRRLALILAAGLLALAVFLVDTFTDIHGAVAVFYVLVLLLSARELNQRGIVGLGMACGLLAGISFAVAHGTEPEASAVLRCATALAAIAITTALLVRDHRSRHLLVSANRALARSERRYRSIFEHTRFSLWEQDYSRLHSALLALRESGVRDLRAYAADNPSFIRDCARLITTTDVNDATLELLGVEDRSQALGPLERFVPPDHWGLLEVLLALFDGRARYEGRGRLLRPDGRSVTVLLGINFPEEPHAFDRVVVGLVDVTQREQMQEALLAAQAELARASRAATVGALSASIAHEINQPLGALVMNAQTCLRWLRRDQPDLEAAARAAERIARDGHRASEIVQRTRSLLIKGEHRRQRVDLRRLVDEVGVLLERDLSRHSARLVKDFEADLPDVLTDPVEMQQVLVNLMTNALHAMAEAGAPEREILVRIEAPAPDLVGVSVRDRGPGISAEALPKLFTPFFTTRTEGMGMGLSICRQVVEASGGHLDAANGADGGAVFSFTLPAAPAEVRA